MAETPRAVPAAPAVPAGRRRVFFVVADLARVGGSERQVSAAAAALARRGHDVTVVSEGPVPAALPYRRMLTDAGVRIAEPRFRTAVAGRLGDTDFVGYTGSKRRIEALVAEGGPPDAVHVQGFGLGTVPVAAWTSARGWPTVYVERSNVREIRPVLWEAELLPDVHLVVGVSQAAADALAALVPGLELAVDRHVLDIPTDGAGRRARDGVLRLAFLGRLAPVKGVDVLLRALAGLPRGGWRLRLGGDGPERAALEALAASLGLTDGGEAAPVRFLGHLDRDAVHALLDDTDVFVLPSRADSGPTVVVEAMAHGCAIVTTALGWVGSMLLDGRNAVVVPVDDAPALTNALAGLLADPARVEALGAAARHTFEEDERDPDSAVDRLLELYALAAERSRARAAAPGRPGAGQRGARRSAAEAPPTRVASLTAYGRSLAGQARRAVRARRADPAAVVLAYHQVRTEPSLDSLVISPGLLRRHFVLLQEAYTVLPLLELTARLEAGDVPPHAVAVTFDDGYADHLHLALPVCEQVGVPATFYVPSQAVGARFAHWSDELADIVERAPSLRTLAERRQAHWSARRSMLDVDAPTRRVMLDRLADELEAGPATAHGPRPCSLDELRSMAASPLVEIGSHSRTHARLARLSSDEQRAELAGSRDELAALIGRPVTGLAYPYGDEDAYDATTVTLAREAGYVYGAVVDERPVRRGTDPYRLSRLFVHGVRDVPQTLRAKIDAALAG